MKIQNTLKIIDDLLELTRSILQECDKDPDKNDLSIKYLLNQKQLLEKLLQNTINELVIWKNLDFFIKQLDERSRTCRECGSKYSEIPIDKGKYLGDNEPIILF